MYVENSAVMHFCFVIQGFLKENDGVNIVGPHVQTYLLACELVRRGHRVSYLNVTSSRGKNLRQKQDGIEVIHVPVAPLPMRLEELHAQYNLWQQLRALRPEVIYTRGRTSLPCVAAKHARTFGAITIWNAAHDRDFNRSEYVRTKISELAFWKRPLARAAYHTTMNRLFEKGIAGTNLAFVQNEYQLQRFNELFPDKQAEILSSLYSSRDDILPDCPSRLLWVGGVKKIKRPEAFLDLAEKLAGKNWRLEMIGPLLDKGYREKIMRAEVVNPLFTYHGPLPFDEVESRFRGAVALVNTSIQEGFPNTFLQAWGNGAAVFTLGVNPNGLLDGTLGFVCDSIANLHSKLVELLSSHQLREIGQRARAYVKKTHSPNLIVEQILSRIDTARMTEKG